MTYTQRLLLRCFAHAAHLSAPPISPATPASTTALRLCVPPPTPAVQSHHVTDLSGHLMMIRVPLALRCHGSYRCVLTQTVSSLL